MRVNRLAGLRPEVESGGGDRHWQLGSCWTSQDLALDTAELLAIRSGHSKTGARFTVGPSPQRAGWPAASEVFHAVPRSRHEPGGTTTAMPPNRAGASVRRLWMAVHGPLFALPFLPWNDAADQQEGLACRSPLTSGWAKPSRHIIQS